MRALKFVVAATCILVATDASACRIRWIADYALPRDAERASNAFLGRIVAVHPVSEGPLGEIEPIVVLRGSAPSPYVVPVDEVIHACSPLTRDWMAGVEVGQRVIVLTNPSDWPYAIVPYESDYGRLILPGILPE